MVNSRVFRWWNAATSLLLVVAFLAAPALGWTQQGAKGTASTDCCPLELGPDRCDVRMDETSERQKHDDCQDHCRAGLCVCAAATFVIEAPMRLAGAAPAGVVTGRPQGTAAALGMPETIFHPPKV